MANEKPAWVEVVRKLASVIPVESRMITEGRIPNEFADFGAVRESIKWKKIDDGTEMTRDGLKRKSRWIPDGMTYVIHKGIDISMGDDQGYVVRSPVLGTVIYSGPSDTFWPYVVVVDDGNGHFHRFAHLSPVGAVDEFVVVRPGSVIGKTSSSAANSQFSLRHFRDPKTGKPVDRNMGAHLHYEITTDKKGQPQTWAYGSRTPVSHYYDPLHFLVTGRYSPLNYKQATPRVEYPVWIG